MKRKEAFKLLSRMELAVGNGHNRFIMSRGSFTYNRIYMWRRTLISMKNFIRNGKVRNRLKFIEWE